MRLDFSDVKFVDVIYFDVFFIEDVGKYLNYFDFESGKIKVECNNFCYFIFILLRKWYL